MSIYPSPGGRPKLARQFRQRLLLVIGVLLLLLLLRVGMTVFITANSVALYREELVIVNQENLLFSSMANQETGLRGYLVTATPIFLQPFDLGRSQYLSARSSLSSSVQQEEWPDTILALSQAQTRAETWYSTFALPTLYQMRKGNLASARSQSSELRGKALFDVFRSSFAHLHQASEREMMTHLAQQTWLNWSFLLASTLLSLLAFLLLWSTFMALYRDLTSQLAALTTMAQLVQAGQKQIRIPPLKHEELELVGHTFNQLIDTLVQLQEVTEEYAQQVSIVNGELQTLFNAVNDAILFVSHDGHIRAINRSFSEFFPLSAEPLIGQRLEDVRAHWVSLFAETNVIQDLLKERPLDERETIMTTVEQTVPRRRDLQVQIHTILSTTSSYLGRVYLFHDITHHNELEHLKRDFVSQVSHELRTPLTSIKGFVSVLLDDPVHLSDDQREFLVIVDENADRLVALVNDLLDLSHIESGKIELERTCFDLNELIERTLQSFTPQLISKQHVLEVRLHDPSPIVFADPARVQQIFSNLVSNAHKYTLSPGTLRVSTDLAGGEAWTQVQDSGVGMTPEEQAHLFTSFYRAKNRLTTHVGGTGLGLVITHSLVELQGGRMQVESQPGQGSTFCFTLPLAPKPLPSEVLLPRQPGKKRLLVVVQDQETPPLFQQLLERHGYEVLITCSGQEALRHAWLEQPDLITLDLHIADSTGFTVFEQLKANPQTAEIPILLLSQRNQQRQWDFLGPLEYLPYPFQEHTLLNQLSRLLNPSRTSVLVLVATPRAWEGKWIQNSLHSLGHTLIITTTDTHLLSLLRRHRPSLIVLDSELPPGGALAAFQMLRSAPDKEVRESAVLVLGTNEGTLSAQWTQLKQTADSQIIGRACSSEEILEAILQQLAVGVRREKSEATKMGKKS